MGEMRKERQRDGVWADYSTKNNQKKCVFSHLFDAARSEQVMRERTETAAEQNIMMEKRLDTGWIQINNNINLRSRAELPKKKIWIIGVLVSRIY